jgi:hypothetical protein
MRTHFGRKAPRKGAQILANQNITDLACNNNIEVSRVSDNIDDGHSKTIDACPAFC